MAATPAFGTLATRLIVKGLVERQQGAGRALVHRLTSKGRNVLEQSLIIAQDVVDGSFSGLSEAERVQLLGLAQGAGKPLCRAGLTVHAGCMNRHRATLRHNRS